MKTDRSTQARKRTPAATEREPSQLPPATSTTTATRSPDPVPLGASEGVADLHPDLHGAVAQHVQHTERPSQKARAAARPTHDSPDLLTEHVASTSATDLLSAPSPAPAEIAADPVPASPPMRASRTSRASRAARGSIFTTRLNLLRDAYRLPTLALTPTTNATSEHERGGELPRRHRGHPVHTAPLSDESFATAINALYRRQHPEDVEQRGTLSPATFRRLRMGLRGTPQTEQLQAIAEFFGVEVSYLVPTTAITPSAASRSSAAPATEAPPLSAAGFTPPTAFQALQHELATRRERVVVLLDALPEALDQLSADQLSHLEREVAHAIQIARHALGEFAQPYPEGNVEALTDTPASPASPASPVSPASAPSAAPIPSPQPHSPSSHQLDAGSDEGRASSDEMSAMTMLR